MGKVGSTSLVQGLGEAKIPNRVFHVHHLALAERKESWRRYRAAGIGPSGRTHHLTSTVGLRDRIRWDRRGEWLVVSGFRDPIARAVSEFFQICEWAYPGLVGEGGVDEERALRFLSDEITGGGPLLSDGLTWFDRELRAVFGIDPLSHPFHRERGWSLITQGRVRLLLYRLESLDAVFQEGLGALLSSDLSLPPTSANPAAEKTSADTYRKVRSRLAFPPEVCREIYAHPVVRHFYTDPQVEEMRAAWEVPGS
jgi:hypothetical protein